MAGNGIRLVRSAGMEGFTGSTFSYPVDPANANPIYSGDAVIWGSTGFIQEATGGADNNDFDILGVFMGCQYVDAEGSIKFKPYWPGVAGAKDINALVAMPSHGRFHIKGLLGATYTQANTIGKRFGVDYTAGNPMYGDSRVALGAATAATGPLRVLGLAKLPGNNWGIAEPIFEVSIVRPQGNA